MSAQFQSVVAMYDMLDRAMSRRPCGQELAAQGIGERDWDEEQETRERIEAQREDYEEGLREERRLQASAANLGKAAATLEAWASELREFVKPETPTR